MRGARCSCCSGRCCGVYVIPSKIGDVGGSFATGKPRSALDSRIFAHAVDPDDTHTQTHTQCVGKSKCASQATSSLWEAIQLDVDTAVGHSHPLSFCAMRLDMAALLASPHECHQVIATTMDLKYRHQTGRACCRCVHLDEAGGGSEQVSQSRESLGHYFS